jgi:hypothetical protein
VFGCECGYLLDGDYGPSLESVSVGSRLEDGENVTLLRCAAKGD